jgi:hypothetical protein
MNSFISVLLYVGLLDICLASDFYQPTQKQVFFSWKQRIGSIWCSLPATLQSIQGKSKMNYLYHPFFVSRRSSLQNRYNLPPFPGVQSFRPSSPGREFLTLVPAQNRAMFQHRRSVPNIKFSSSYPSGIDMTSVERNTVDKVEYASTSYEGLQHSRSSLKLKTSENQPGYIGDVTDEVAVVDDRGGGA